MEGSPARRFALFHASLAPPPELRTSLIGATPAGAVGSWPTPLCREELLATRPRAATRSGLPRGIGRCHRSCSPPGRKRAGNVGAGDVRWGWAVGLVRDGAVAAAVRAVAHATGVAAAVKLTWDGRQREDLVDDVEA